MLRSKDTIIFAIATPRGSQSAQKIVALRHTQIPIPSISPSPPRAPPTVPARPRELDFTSHPHPMEALDMLLSRRSVKRFAPDVLPAHSDLQRIADAGANAPTGRGRQSPFIVVVTDRAVRDQLSRLNAEILGRDGDPFYGAPVVMVVLADRAQPTYLYDGSLVMGNLLNAAHAPRLGCLLDSPRSRNLRTPGGQSPAQSVGHRRRRGRHRLLRGGTSRTLPLPSPSPQRGLHPFRLIACPTPSASHPSTHAPGRWKRTSAPGKKDAGQSAATSLLSLDSLLLFSSLLAPVCALARNARIRRFSFFLFTPSPTPRNHLLFCELGVKALLPGASPLLHPTSAQKVPAATTCIARFRMVNFV